MSERKQYTKEEKEDLIRIYLPGYLELPRVRIDGMRVTEELFYELSFENQWSRIYNQFIRRDLKINKVKSMFKEIEGYVNGFTKLELDTMTELIDGLRDYVESRKKE